MKSFWDRIKGDAKHRTKSGYMILGPNCADGELCDWHSDTLDGPLGAIEMAKHFSKSSGSCYEILKYEYIGVVRPVPVEVEFVQPEHPTESLNIQKDPARQ
jgi:hypothetical protein